MTWEMGTKNIQEGYWNITILFFLQISLFVSLKTQDFVYLEMLLLSFRLFKVNIYIMTKVGTENLIACVSKQDFLQS